MNINTGFNPYNGSIINGADRTKMAQSQSLTGSATDSLKEGEVFEGSVNSIENGKVTIGLANGQTMTARLDSSVNLVPGQSVFFQVKSNDGSLIQIRPVSLNGLDANPTLLKALDLANIAPNERTINMVNTMMQNSMSVSPENLASMHRVLLNNPEVDVQTIVTMAKHGMDITPDNIAMFQNYANDKAVISDNFKVISDMLTEVMTSDELTAKDVINLNSQVKAIFVEGATEGIEGQPMADAAAHSKEGTPVANEPQADSQVVATKEQQILQSDSEVASAVAENAGKASSDSVQVVGQGENAAVNSAKGPIIEEGIIIGKEQPEVAGATTSQQGVNTIASQTGEAAPEVSDAGAQALNTFASDKQITSFNSILNNLPDFPKDNMEIFNEDGTFKADANIKEVFREISDYLENHPDIPKSTLNDIIKTPLYKGLLRNILADSFAMEPKDITKPGELSKMYERVLKQNDALEKLISAFSGKAAETIKAQTAEVRQNINFMNSANEMYNFVQIPLKMYNQNTDSMLYVRQNKKSSYEAGEEITAFLHFDMEHLGPTDIFVSLKEAKVGCKWNLADEAALKLIESNIDILTERLAKKGFWMTSEMTCGEPKASFVEDFLGDAPITKETTNEGIMHRYSFDMRA